MDYNLDFLFAGLCLLLIVIAHYIIHPRSKDYFSRFFETFLSLALLDVALDVVTTYFMDWANPSYRVVAIIFHSIFYLLQCLIPYMMLLYTFNVRNVDIRKTVKARFLWFIPLAIMTVLIFVNLFTGFLFTYDASGAFVRGPYNLLIYVDAALYGLVALVSSIIHRSEISNSHLWIICVFFVLTYACVGIQFINPNLLMTGFSVSLGLTLLYLTISNPAEALDNLTKTFDRRQLFMVVEQYLSLKKSFYAIMIEAYRLSDINDTYGMTMGDYLIKGLADSLNKVNNRVAVYRNRGSRFVMLCDSYSDYESTLAKVKDLFIDHNFQYEDTNISFPVLICGMKDVQHLKDTMECQQYCDYLAEYMKTNKLWCIESNGKTYEGFEYSKFVTNYLHQAIEEDLFEIYFQPIYNTKTHKYTSMESLSRLIHPQKGFISPLVFIRIAEKEGIIDKVDMLQMERICNYLEEHRDLMDTLENVKFNLSPAAIIMHGYIENLIDIIRRHNLPVKWLQFEITENMPTEYNVETLHTIKMLQENGASMCLDDFGSGYANFSSVLKMPFDTIKIDKSLFDYVEEDEKVRL